MKHMTTHIVSVVALTLPILLVAGCPMDMAQLDASPVLADMYPDLAGQYWVEYADGELAIFRLPQVRGDDGDWLEIAADMPTWYTGPALYEVDDTGMWQRVTQDDSITLDEIIQLHDPVPAIP